MTSKLIDASLYKIVNPGSFKKNAIEDSLQDATLLERLYEDRYALIPLLLRIKNLKLKLDARIGTVVLALQDPR